MPLSQADADKIITKIQDDFYKKWMASDAKGLSTMYHPDAVLMERGGWVAYGREEIEKRYVEFTKTPLDFKLNFELISSAVDGEFIIHRGSFVFPTFSDKTAPYMQIYKREPDGNYLIIHDIFDKI